MDVLNDYIEAYGLPNDKQVHKMIRLTREGITYAEFELIADNSAFTLDQWRQFLHVSERTLQRYKKDNKNFEPLRTEKILELLLLQKYSRHVFENQAYFKAWLNTNCLALGNIPPISLLDSSFGIQIVKDELGRIEHGIFA